MKILAFMQNMWVRDPERVRADIEKHGEEFRLRFIEFALFRGCLTGRRLRAAFGDLCDEIVWEESTREIAGDPKAIFDPDPVHIKAVIVKHNPDVVITFGRIAGNAVASLWDGRIVRAPHPAARQADIVEKLNQAARDLKQACTPLEL